MNPRRCLLGCSVLCVFALTTAATAQEGQDKPGGQGAELDPQAQMEAQMEAWMEAGKPGPEHKNLDYMVGTWKASVKYWMEPGSDAETSTGTAKSEWVLDGRYVKTEYSGEFMEGPFKGIGFCGYDKIENKYVSIWVDSMSTSPMVDRGTYDASKKEFTYQSTCKTPDGGQMESKTVIQIVSPDKHVMTMYHQMPGMSEMVKAMEITYERSGGARG